MHKIISFIFGFCFIVVCSSCGNGTASQSDEADLTRAAIIAHDFVKSNFASDCDFSELDIRGEAIENVPGRFKVLQKFTSSRDGYEQEYVYRIYMQFYGGEWSDIHNWDYGQLTIENTSTGKQFFYNGKMKERDNMASTSGEITIAGIAFKQIFWKAVVIYSTSEQVPYEKLKEVANLLKDSSTNKTIQFYVDSNIENGTPNYEYYAQLSGSTFFYAPLNKIETLK